MPSWIVALISTLIGGGASLSATWWSMRTAMKRAREERAAEARQATYLDFLSWYDEKWGFLLTAPSERVSISTYRSRQIPEALLARLAVFCDEGFAKLIEQYREVGDWVRHNAFDSQHQKIADETAQTSLVIIQEIRGIIARDLGTGSPAFADEMRILQNRLMIWRVSFQHNFEYADIADFLRKRHESLKKTLNEMK